MAIHIVREYLAGYDMEDRIMEHSSSSATVELAAQAIGVEPARIAKTLALHAPPSGGLECLLVVTSGDAKIDNGKFKERFGLRSKMLSAEETLARTNHDIGGVCPFGVPESAGIYIDVSLKRFDTVFPACGSSNSSIELTLEELVRLTGGAEFVDVCKGWELLETNKKNA